MAAKKQSWLALLAAYRFELFLLLLAVLPQIYIAFSNNNTILDWYSSDDGFYYFQVARNLAAGHGFTFDGLNPANGFHPLWLFLITPIFIFAQFDKLLPLRFLMLFSALLSAGTAILLYRILKQCVSAWVGALAGVLWIVVPRFHDLALHTGTEAGLSAFCILLFWFFLLGFDPQASPITVFRCLAGLSLLGALAIFARLDNAFLVALGGLWAWFRIWQPPARRDPWSWRLATGFAFAAPVVVLLFIYLIWNSLVFGTLAPVSGQVKVWWGTLHNTVYGFPVNDWKDFAGQFFTNDPELGPWSLLTAPLYSGAESVLSLLGGAASVGARRWVLLGIGGVLAALGAALVRAERRFVAAAASKLGLLPFLLGCVLQICYYKLAGSVAQQPWYWISEMLWLLLALGVLLAALLRWLSCVLPKDAQRPVPAFKALALAAMALAFLGHVQAAVRAPGDGSNHFYIARAHWLEAHTELGARVAITGAGSLAYFTEGRTIVNMDGLMNTIDYLHALQGGQGADYLAGLGVDYIFGNEYILTQTNPYEPMLAGHLQPYAVYTFADRELPLWKFVP